MNRTVRSVQMAINAELKAHGLPSLTWYDILWAIEMHGGKVRPFQLQEAIIFEQSSLSHRLRRLEGEGLIETRSSSEDRRGKVLCITDKGRALRRDMWAVYGRMLGEMVDPLPDDADISPVLTIADRLTAPG